MYLIKAFKIISKARRFITFSQGGGFYQELSLQDIQSYFDVYGCDIKKELFVSCIFALDGKFLSQRNS